MKQKFIGVKIILKILLIAFVRP